MLGGTCWPTKKKKKPFQADVLTRYKPERRKYDYQYIEYLREIVQALPRYGLNCIIDAHQDVFSRLTGGSGAPGWVLSTVGLNLKTLHSAHAAHLHPFALLPLDPPPSVWPTGYQKLAAATCNTVFWAGDTFAWKTRAPDGSGRGLSTFLQEAMCDAFGKLADALEACEAMMGFEVGIVFDLADLRANDDFSP